MFINTFLDVNKTEVELDPQDGLEDNQKYTYTVTAINTFGMITTDEYIICNSFSINGPMNIYNMYLIIHGAILDVQSVNITVVDESAIVDIQCLFIPGSDALGCKVVLVREY